MFAFGDVDVSWADHGRAIARVSHYVPSDAAARDLSVVGDKIYALGSYGVARFSLSGEPDSSFFGSVGKHIGTGMLAQRIIVDGSDNIFLFGRDDQSTMVRKYKPTGVLDDRFGSSGTIQVEDEHLFDFRAATRQSDGKWIVLGTEHIALGDKVRVYRFTSAGKIDTSFGHNGKVDLQLGLAQPNSPGIANDVAQVRVLSSGKIVIAGVTRAYDPTDDPDFPNNVGSPAFVAARLTSSGALDSAYGKSGIARVVIESAEQIRRFLTKESQVLNFFDEPSSVATISNSGEATIVCRGLALEAIRFDSSGKVKFRSEPIAGFRAEQVYAMVDLADGRSVFLGQPHFGDQPIITAIAANGEIGPWVSVQDDDPKTKDLYQALCMAVAPDGTLLIGGRPSTALHETDGYALEKYSPGTASDSRPDDFANGLNSSIARGYSNLYLAYFDDATKTLKCARRSNTGRWTAPVTVDATPNAGVYISLAVTTKDQPRIAYFDGQHGDLRYAESNDNGATWKTSLVDYKGSTGLYPSLTIDGADRVSIAYYSKKNHALNFASLKEGSRWHIVQVDGDGDVGRNASLFFTTNSVSPDIKHYRYAIAYTDDTHKSVKCAFYRGNGVWETQVASQTEGGSAYVSGVFTDFGDDAVGIAYYDVKDGDLKFARRLGRNFRWDSSTLASAGDVGLYNHVVQRDDHLAVFSYNRTTDSAFMNDAIEPATVGGGEYLSVYSFNGWTDIAYVDSSDHFLKVRNGPTPQAAQEDPPFDLP